MAAMELHAQQGLEASAHPMGRPVTCFSRAAGGIRREMLCLNMNFAFKSPVFADPDITLQWRLTSTP